MNSVQAPRIHFVTMGCAKNEVDTQDMETRLRVAGFSIESDIEQADCVVVNTCSFIQSATEESLQAIFDVSDLPKFRSGVGKLVVAGCMPARYGTDLESELAEASSFVPCSKEDDIVEVLSSLYPQAQLGEGCATVPSALSEYVKISDGCNRFCSFCTIPFIRGRYHSYTVEQILEDVERKVAGGAREIVLIAQDTGIWGNDFQAPDTLASLLERIACSFPTTWIRVMYLQPAGITDQLLETMARYDNICSYFDIPLQHCDEALLRSMNRQGSAPEYLQMIDKIRSAVPGVALRTTMIAGYPGETEEQARALCDFLEDAEFDYVGVFPYSREDGTKAAEMDNQIDEDIKMERTQEIRDVSEAVSGARMSTLIGSMVDVLILGCEDDGQLFGRTMQQAPEVDGLVFVDRGEIGDVVKVEIVDSLGYLLEGEVRD